MRKRNKSYRIAQSKRLRAKRVRNCYWGIGRYSESGWRSGQLGFAVNTPKPHTCYYARNIRKIEGETRQERRSSDSMKYDLKSI